MKKYLLPNDVNWYRANMHNHTTFSDGHMTPEEIKEAYMNHGYSIVAYTDHEILLDHSELSDENFLAITSSEYSITERESSFKPISVPDNGFQGRKTIHLNIFSKEPHMTFMPAANVDNVSWCCGGKFVDVIKTDGYRREYTLESINETIKRCNEAGFLVQYNHPYWSLNEREDYIHLKGLWALEILNFSTELETGADYCPYIYDDMVRNGMTNLFCTMGDDNHNGGKSLSHSFGGSTFIGAKELKYDQIFDAMKKGNLYCASGKDNPPQFKELYVENNTVVIECSPVVSVFFTGYARADRHYYDENGMTHAEFKLRKQDEFFRITIRDKFGNSAHTHYYNVKDYWEEQ